MDVVGLSTSLREAIDRNAEVHTHSAFLISPETGKTSSFQEIKQHSILLSRMLRLAGLEKGDKVAFLMDNGLLTAQLFLGAMYGGFVAVPLNVRAGVSQLTYMLDHSDASVVFAILRANVNRRLPRQRLMAENVIELGSVVLREKHIVPVQRKSVGFRNGTPRHRGQ